MNRQRFLVLHVIGGVILSILLFGFFRVPPISPLTANLISNPQSQQTSTKLPSPPQLSSQTGLTDPQELEAFLDQFFAEQMPAQHIPGAVFVLVKDGNLFFSKGYGYADLEKQIPVIPEKTVFRVGSISKVLTATAVMQLVEQGKLNLTENINHYLQHFHLKNNYSQPVTTTNLLTHTSGIDESFIGIAARHKTEIQPLENYLAKHLPPRSLPPAKVLRYSNHGFALAGYLVEVISHIPFAEYIDKNILQPLGMKHSSFLLEPKLIFDMAVGYQYKRDRYQQLPIVYTNDIPSGAFNTTAIDMAHFAIAHLQNGRYGNERILQENTVQEMHQQHFTHHPQLPGQTYGFCERFENGLRALEHDGHIAGFKSRLFLLPKQKIGFFSSYNNNEGTFHNELISQFLDHYYPESENVDFQEILDLKIDREKEKEREFYSFSLVGKPLISHSQNKSHSFTGNYRYIRYPHRSIEKLTVLLPDSPLSTSEFKVTTKIDGTLVLGKSHLVEVEPMLFKQFEGSPVTFQGITFPNVAFRENDRGQITHLFMGKYAFEKLAWYETKSVQLSLLGFCIIVFLIPGSAWFVKIFKKSCDQQLLRCLFTLAIDSNSITHFWIALANLVCGLNLVFIISFILMLTVMDLSQFVYGMPRIVMGLLWIPLLSASLTMGLPIFAVLVWRYQYWSVFARLCYSLITLAAWGFMGFLNYWNILGFRF